MTANSPLTFLQPCCKHQACGDRLGPVKREPPSLSRGGGRWGVVDILIANNFTRSLNSSGFLAIIVRRSTFWLGLPYLGR